MEGDDLPLPGLEMLGIRVLCPPECQYHPALLFMGFADDLQNVALYAFSFFLPIILKDGFGYSTGKANLLMFPPYACAMPVC